MAMRNKQKLLDLAFETSVLYASEFKGEPFHEDYTKNKDIFRRLMKTDRALEKSFTKYFKDLATRLHDSEIDWVAYENKQMSASEIDNWVLVDWDEEALKIKVVLTDALVEAIVAGGMLMELDSKIDIGWNKNAPTVMDFIDKYGLKLAKKLDATTEDKIKSSLKLSISNGEQTWEARNRIVDVIDDPDRASTIARTESVQAFGAGRRAVADELDWNYKQWHTVMGACEICLQNGQDGRIEKAKVFSGSETDQEPGHPNCRCSVRYYKDAK